MPKDKDYGNLKKRFSPFRDNHPSVCLGLCLAFDEFVTIDTPSGQIQIHLQAVGYNQANVKFNCPREFSITRIKYTGEKYGDNV